MDLFTKLFSDLNSLNLILIANSGIILAQIINQFLDDTNYTTLIFLIITCCVLLYQVISCYFKQIRISMSIYFECFVLTIVSVEVQLSTLFLLFQQLAIFDSIFITKQFRNQLQKLLIGSAVSIINFYLFIRIWIKYSETNLFIYALLQSIIIKLICLHINFSYQKLNDIFQQEEQNKLNHAEMLISNEKSVPRSSNSDDEINAIHLFKAFDVIPEGVIILDKNLSDQFQVKYSNKAAKTLLDTNQDEELLNQLLEFKGIFTLQKSEEQIFRYSFSIQSQQSAYKMMSKQVQVKSLYKFSQQFIKENYNQINKQADQTPQSLNNQDYQFSTFPPVQIFFPSIQTKLDCSLHPNSPSIHYTNQNKKNDETECLINLLQSLWQGIVQICKEKDKINYGNNNPMCYVHESELFVTSVKQKQKKRGIDLKVFSGFHQNSPILVILIRDVSHKDYIKLLLDYNSQKSKTLSFVSHEFRTPLNCIISMLESVVEASQNLTSNDQLLLKSALDNSKYILNLSNDLLDLAQIKAGKFKIYYQKFDLHQLLKECVNMFQIQAQKKHISLNFFYDKLLPSEIVSDANRIRQITVNLIGNAMKFTIEGSINLRAYQDEPDVICIEVNDTGLGIREEDQPKLIKAFAKIENKEASQLNAQGVGLGLLISNSIATQLNLESRGLGFRSVYQEGTTFCFLITNHKTSEDLENFQDSNKEVDVQSKINHVRRQSQQEKKFIVQKTFCGCPQILIVDDSQFNIETLVLVMNRTFKPNISTDYTISGLLAEQKVKQRFQKQGHQCVPYRLIFMDIEMPVQDGIKTAINIKEYYKNMGQQVKIVGCSGYVQEIEKQNCLQYMDDYIVKPVNKKELERIINTYFYYY